MATLEKIRKKSALLFIIIIVALLAFILGDFLTSGRTYFGHPTTVAKAGGVTVEYQDYQQRLAQAGEQLRNQGRDYSNDVLTQTVIQGLLTEQLLKKEYNDLGIKVTDKELSEALTGEHPHPAAQQMIYYLSQQLGLPEISGSVIFDAIQNPAKYGLPAEAGQQLRSIWSDQEKNVEAAMLNQKFMSLVNGLYTYNKLDAKNFYDDNAVSRHISYVNKDIAGVPDEAIEFSDADVKAYWESEKENYRIPEETREIQYIYVPIEPSRADRIEGQNAVENAVVALNEKPGTEGVAADSRFVVSTERVPLSAIRDNNLSKFVKENPIGTAAVINRESDTYTIAKVLETSTGIDSINISMLQAAPEVNLDSILATITPSTALASLSNGSNIAGQDSVWTSLEVTGIDAKVRDALANATIGKAFILTDSIQGNAVSAIYRVNKRNSPKDFYDLAVIEFTVDPSQETLSDLSTALRTYVSNNSSADEFEKNATDAGYSLLSDQVSNSSVGIGNAHESRRFVKWAMDAKKGQVSPLLQDDRQSYLLAVAVQDIYNDYLPYTSPAINTRLTTQARNAKKAEKLLADYAGKANDIEGYSKLMNAEVAEGNVNITTPTLLSVGVGESALQGAIAAAPQGKLVGPVKGNRGVMVFEVKQIDTDNRPYNEAEYGNRFNSTFGLARRPNTLVLLLGSDKIDNRSLNFVQAVGE